MADIIDFWVNLLSEESANEFLARRENVHMSDYLGGTAETPPGVRLLLSTMDSLGVTTGVLTPGLTNSGITEALEIADAHPGRFLVAPTVVQPERCTRNARMIRQYAEHPALCAVRIAPLFTQVAIDDAKHYPIYQTCEELGLAMSINVGIPGPRVRSRVQHPELLEDVLIDFSDLVVIGAHMGHPYEDLLLNYMRKWDNLYLSCTAYAPRYLEPEVVAFMQTRSYRGRIIWGSDEPWFTMERSLGEAKELPLDDEARELFLGGTAARLLRRE